MALFHSCIQALKNWIDVIVFLAHNQLSKQTGATTKLHPDTILRSYRFRSSQECCEHQAVPTQIAHKAPRNQSNECLQDQLFSTKEVNLSEHIFEIWIMHFCFFLIFSASEIWASHGPWAQKNLFNMEKCLRYPYEAKALHTPDFLKFNWIDNYRNYPKITIFLNQNLFPFHKIIMLSRWCILYFQFPWV